MTSLGRLTYVLLFLPKFSLFPLSDQNQEKDINAQLVLSICSFMRNIVSTSTKSQHASIFIYIKANA